MPRCDRCGGYRRGAPIYSNYPVITPLRSLDDRSLDFSESPEIVPTVGSLDPDPVPLSEAGVKMEQIIELVGSEGISVDIEKSLTQAIMEVAMLFAINGFDLNEEQLSLFIEMSKESDQCCLKHFLKRDLGY